MAKNISRPRPEKYTPTESEQAALDRYHERAAATISPRVKLVDGEIDLDHPDGPVAARLLMEAFGTADQAFATGLLRQLSGVATQKGEVDEYLLNFMASVVAGIEPKDQLEALLAAQMAGVHVATMRLARQLSNTETLAQQDSAERALNKLARTFASQVEALKRYRTGGEQKVTVQHVSVSDGGQAIVGNVTHTAREPAQSKSAQSPPALTDQQRPAMAMVHEVEPSKVRARRPRRK